MSPGRTAAKRNYVAGATQPRRRILLAGFFLCALTICIKQTACTVLEEGIVQAVFVISGSDVQKVTEYLKRSICVMCKNTFCKDFSKLNAFLVEAVQVPYEALEHDLVLKVSKKCTKRCRVQVLTNDNAGGTFALEVLIQVLILFTAGKCYDLSSNVCAEFLLAGAVLNIHIYAKLALPEADELERDDVRALVKELIERVLSIGSWLTEDNWSCHIVYWLAETVYSLAVGFHVTLLKVCRETA